MAAKTKESQHVKKVREKLQKKIEKENKQMTRDALMQMERVIEGQLARHASERIDLKSKEIALFDANRHPAAVKSKFVSHLLQELKEDSVKPKVTVRQLKGRIKTS